jgi:outer membrane protein TolC
MKSLCIALLVGLAVSGAAVAQERAAALSLSVDQAIDRALAASHRLIESAARTDQSAAVVDQRRSTALPQVTALAGYTRTNHVDEFGLLTPTNQFRVIYPDVPDNYRALLDVQWPIYNGGRLAALVDAARKESAAAGDDLDSLKADVTLDVTRAFWTLVTADETARVLAESLTRMSAHLRDVRNQLDAGLVPPNEVLTVQAQESRQRMLSIQATSARDVAEADLARLVGAAPGTSILPTAVLEPAAQTQTADALVTIALASRRDRQALVDRLAAAGHRQQAAVAERRPTIAVGGGVDYANPNPRIFPREESWKTSWDAGVNVSWPLFDGGRARADVAEASAGERAMQARLDELDSLVAFEVRQRLAEIS